MSLPNQTNNIMQQQNLVINHMPMQHTIMTNVNANNGIPIATALSNAPTVIDQSGDIKTGIMMDTLPMAGASLVGVQSVPMQGTSPVKVAHNASNMNAMNSSEAHQVLSKTRMSDLVRDIDPNIYMEEDVEEILLTYVDDFVDRVLNGASMIAKHRHNNNIEVKDVQQFINRNFNMWVPGLGTDELRPYKRSLTTESHKQRLALIRKALKKY